MASAGGTGAAVVRSVARTCSFTAREGAGARHSTGSVPARTDPTAPTNHRAAPLAGSVPGVSDTRTDWVQWHAPYADPDSSLSRRRRVVQGHVERWLDELPTSGLPARVVSACAGDGRDLLEVLAARPHQQVTALLVELDAQLAADASSFATDRRLDRVEVRSEDAGSSTAYRGHVPAGLVLLCGVFGNVSDDDVRRTVDALPLLCAPGATVVWTRGRRDGSLEAAQHVRDAFGAAGHDEVAFTAPDDQTFTVGAHRYDGGPAAFQTGRQLFTFQR